MVIKILSYNIHKGFSLGNRGFILNDIRNAIREVNADILFLQEVVGDHTKLQQLETAAQFEFLADSVWSHYAYGKNAIYTEGHHGNAILSKFPIVEWKNKSISTNRFEQRGFLKTKINIPEMNKDIIIANTHLDLTQRGRDLQSNIIIDELAPLEDQTWIMVGDFNDWNKKIAKKIKNHLNVVEAYEEIHGKFPLTYPSLVPMLSLDRIFLNNCRVLEAKTLTGKIWRSLSDHLPLYAEIEIS